jgi:WD40 repeat protein
MILLVNSESGVIENTLTTSTLRVLSLEWSPHFEYVLATGSFDNIVRVFDLKKKTTLLLKEHKDRVRSLTWNYELPWMLISAADDS